MRHLKERYVRRDTSPKQVNVERARPPPVRSYSPVFCLNSLRVLQDNLKRQLGSAQERSVEKVGLSRTNWSTLKEARGHELNAKQFLELPHGIFQRADAVAQVGAEAQHDGGRKGVRSGHEGLFGVVGLAWPTSVYFLAEGGCDSLNTPVNRKWLDDRR